MSNFCLFSDGVNDYVQLDSVVTIPSSTPCRIEIDFESEGGSDFGVRLLGNIGSDTSRIIIWKGDNPNYNWFGTYGTLGGVNILKRSTWAFYREDTITGKVSVDGIEMPEGPVNSIGTSFDVLMTTLSVTNARNPVKLYSLKVWLEDVLLHHWDPSASNGTGNILYDVVGGNHGTLINYPVDESQWQAYAPVADVVLTVGPTGDYATIEDAAAAIPADLIVANARYIIEIEDKGTPYTPLGAGFNFAGYTTDPLRYLLIKAKSGHEWDPETNTGVYLLGSTPFQPVLALNTTYAAAQGMKVESTADNPSYAMSLQGGYTSASDMYVKASSTSPGYAVKPAGRDSALINSITEGGQVGISSNNYSYRVFIKNCTIINPTDTAIVRGTTQCTPTIVNTVHQGSGTLAATSTGWGIGSINNATSEVSPANTFGGTLETGISDDNFVDYAAGDYRIASGSTLALANIGAFIAVPSEPGEAIEHFTSLTIALIAGSSFSYSILDRLAAQSTESIEANSTLDLVIRDSVAFSSQLDTRVSSSNTSTIRDVVSNTVSKQVLAYQQVEQEIVDAYAGTITYTVEAEPLLNTEVLDRSTSLVNTSTLGLSVFSNQVRDVLLQNFSENTTVLASFIQPTPGSIHTTFIIGSVHAGGLLPTLIHDTYSGAVYEDVDAAANSISLVKDSISSINDEIVISYSTNTSQVRDASASAYSAEVTAIGNKALVGIKDYIASAYSAEVTAIGSKALVEIKDYIGSAFVLDTNTQAVSSTLVLDEIGNLVGITTQAIFTEYFFAERPKLRLQPQDLFTQINSNTNIKPSINIITPLNKLRLGAVRL